MPTFLEKKNNAFLGLSFISFMLERGGGENDMKYYHYVHQSFPCNLLLFIALAIRLK